MVLNSFRCCCTDLDSCAGWYDLCGRFGDPTLRFRFIRRAASGDGAADSDEQLPHDSGSDESEDDDPEDDPEHDSDVDDVTSMGTATRLRSGVQPYSAGCGLNGA